MLAKLTRESAEYQTPLILVVDDTPALLDTVRTCLQDEGYRVRTCLQSRDALRIALEEPPDVVMLDIVMPEVSGWEVLAELRANPRFAHTPVIVCTGWVAEALGRLEELQGPGHDNQLGFLPKPFDLDELLEVVASITGRGADHSPPAGPNGTVRRPGA